jgi:hypothetical protein
MRLIRRLKLACSLVLSLAAVGLLAAGPAAASKSQIALFQPGPRLLSDPQGTLNQLNSLGVGAVRVIMTWSSVAPSPNSQTRPAGFNATDPNAYPAANWAPYDAVVRDAESLGIRVDFTLSSGAPLWAQGPGIPPEDRTSLFAWKPSPSEYGAFVTAVGHRYNGAFVATGQATPLPRVSFWQLWNEPNFGKNLAPQATNGSTVAASAAMYRTLLDAGWNALKATSHGGDIILIGSLAARGAHLKPRPGTPEGLPGNYGTTKPLQFSRALYCVDSSNRQLKGSAASAIGCPSSAGAFRAAHPSLFSASGFAIHPYPVNLPPNRAESRDPDFAQLAQLPHVALQLDALQRHYGSGKRFPIYVTEYGYITNSPNRSNHYVSLNTAANYINWAEYLSWRNSRIATAMQYPLYDPDPAAQPEFGGFASGLFTFAGKQKATYSAYRMPLFLPVTSAKPRRSLEVWGCVRPAHNLRGTQRVAIQFRPGSRGAFNTLKTVKLTSPRGYFDVRVTFPASGQVRLGWTRFQSRTVTITVK